MTSPGRATSPGPVINTLLPTFQWNAVSGADDYDLTVYRSPYTSSDVVYEIGTLTGTSYTLPAGIMFGGESYAWQVKASNVAGTSDFSTMFYFESPGSIAPPAVTTVAASSIESNGATLNGNLTDLGSASGVSVSFEYGTSTSYGSTTDGQLMSAAGTFDAVVTGLPRVPLIISGPKPSDLRQSSGSDMTITTSAAVAPAVTTRAATDISINGATLNGNLTSLGSVNSVSVSFEYGTTTSYGSTTASQNLAAAGSFDAFITALVPNTAYHFRAVAVGSSTVYGSDMTFSTAQQSAAPAVVTNLATGVTATNATLNGNLTSLGGASSINVDFEYGTYASYGNTTTIQQMTSTGSFTADISGLTPNTQYHFQAVAGGGSATAYGGDIVFTTLPVTSATPTSSSTVTPTAM